MRKRYIKKPGRANIPNAINEFSKYANSEYIICENTFDFIIFERLPGLKVTGSNMTYTFEKGKKYRCRYLIEETSSAGQQGFIYLFIRKKSSLKC